MTTKPIPSALLTFILFLAVSNANAQTVDMPGPGGSGAYGTAITVLTNGNYVVTDPSYSEGGLLNIGAVYLYNGSSHALISILKGSSANDRIGWGIVRLQNGNFVVQSPYWTDGIITNAGAATWCSGVTGLSGTINRANSLVGTTEGDFVGGTIQLLPNGNYVVAASNWSNGAYLNVGAATWCNGATGLAGAISSANSLVGTAEGDFVGYHVTPLANGNYVVSSEYWHNHIGAATWCNGTTGLSGFVDESNSFTGNSVSEVIPLSNGNYLVRSAGITWGNGLTGLTGTANDTNTWSSSSTFTQLTFGAIVLQNGNYLITGVVDGEPSVTWANGSTGAVQPRTTANSFLSALNIVALPNGAYVLSNPFWNNNRGAAILCNADGSTTGTFNSSNSLIGNPNDSVSSGGIIPLSNSNFVVSSPNWNGQLGAATFCRSDGTTIGQVSSSNSLVGTNANDSVGSGTGKWPFWDAGVCALANGNYVVVSPNWNNKMGAVTWGSGLNGVTGPVSANNSLTASVAADRLGSGGISVNGFITSGFRPLNNGNYTVASTFWNGNTGAVSWGNGNTGTIGTLSSQNSLTGVTRINTPITVGLTTTIPSFTTTPTIYDGGGVFYFRYYGQLSYDGRKIFPNLSLKNLSDNYVVQGIDGNTGKATITWGNGRGGTTGSPNSCNTIFGDAVNGLNNMIYTFDSVYNYLLVGRPGENVVTRYYPALGTAVPSNNDNSTATVGGTGTIIFPSTTGCGQIASLTPSGSSPVNGSVAAKTWLETKQPANFVARHYEITPAVNAGTSTGTITLYFTQADFDGFNNQIPAPALKLPSGASDAAGIANLLVQKISGTSNAGTGFPNTYTGPAVNIDPADNNIVWNTALSRWEITFDVNGFSGFFIISKPAAVLPVQLLNFSGTQERNGNLLAWETTNEVNTVSFELESSANGSSFGYVGSVAATGGGNYSFTDNNPLTNRTYYRLKIIDADARFSYSDIIWIDGTVNNNIRLYPNPVSNNTTLYIRNNINLVGTAAILTDATGRFIRSFIVKNKAEQFSMSGFPAGLYFLKLNNGSVIKIFKR